MKDFSYHVHLQGPAAAFSIYIKKHRKSRPAAGNKVQKAVIPPARQGEHADEYDPGQDGVNGQGAPDHTFLYRVIWFIKAKTPEKIQILCVMPIQVFFCSRGKRCRRRE
jgi:hypothetical protein